MTSLDPPDVPRPIFDNKCRNVGGIWKQLLTYELGLFQVRCGKKDHHSNCPARLGPTRLDLCTAEFESVPIELRCG